MGTGRARERVARVTRIGHVVRRSVTVRARRTRERVAGVTRVGRRRSAGRGVGRRVRARRTRERVAGVTRVGRRRSVGIGARRTPAIRAPARTGVAVYRRRTGIARRAVRRTSDVASAGSVAGPTGRAGVPKGGARTGLSVVRGGTQLAVIGPAADPRSAVGRTVSLRRGDVAIAGRPAWSAPPARTGVSVGRRRAGLSIRRAIRRTRDRAGRTVARIRPATWTRIRGRRLRAGLPVSRGVGVSAGRAR
jgi:hypothetical protein